MRVVAVLLTEKEPRDIAPEVPRRRPAERAQELFEAAVEGVDVLDVERPVADALALASSDGDVPDVGLPGELLVGVRLARLSAREHGVVGTQDGVRVQMTMENRAEVLVTEPRQDFRALAAGPVEHRQDGNLPARETTLHRPFVAAVFIPAPSRRRGNGRRAPFVVHPLPRAFARLPRKRLVSLHDSTEFLGADVLDGAQDQHSPAPGRHPVDAVARGRFAARARPVAEHIADGHAVARRRRAKRGGRHAAACAPARCRARN